MAAEYPGRYFTPLRLRVCVELQSHRGKAGAVVQSRAPGCYYLYGCMARCPLLDFSSLLSKEDAMVEVTSLVRDRADLEC